MKTHLSLLLTFSLVVSCSLAFVMRFTHLLKDQSDLQDDFNHSLPLCPNVGSATVFCNRFAEDPCYCVNVIPKDQVIPDSGQWEPIKAEDLCDDDYFNYTHIVEIGFNITVTDETPNWINGRMKTLEVELNLLLAFNVNLRDKSLRKRYYDDMFNDLRIMRFWCDNENAVMSVFVGFKATANTTSEDKNVTLEDLGYDVDGIKNVKFLDVVYLKSLSKKDLQSRLLLLENVLR